MMVALKVMMYVLGVASHTVTIRLLYLCFFRPQHYLSIMEKPDGGGYHRSCYVYIGLFIIGLSILWISGFQSILSWIPYSWRNDDGAWMADSIAWLMGGSMGLVSIDVIHKAAAKFCKLEGILATDALVQYDLSTLVIKQSSGTREKSDRITEFLLEQEIAKKKHFHEKISMLCAHHDIESFELIARKNTEGNDAK